MMNMNIQMMMQQAQRMQREIMNKKEEINKKIFPGKYEWVEVSFNGNKEIQSILINKEKIENDDIEMLEDMIILAIKDSMNKIDKEVEEKLGKYGSLNGLL